MTRITEISREQLAPIVTARTKTIELAQVAEQAIKDARMAELEFKVQIQQLYLEKGLNSNCRVDINTGVVTWPVDEADAAVVDVVEEPKGDVKPARKKASAKKKDTTVVDEVETTV